jgi:predicted DNA-binding transcriptional regulator YafY
MAKKKKLDIPQRSEEDRRAQQAVRMANVLGILERLLQRSKWNVKSLAADLELSERTVHRYLDVLEMVGVPFYYDREEKCYRVRPGYTFPVANLTSDEALGQATATVISEAVGLDDATTARPTTRKIAARSREATRDLLSDAEAVMAVLDLKLADHSRHREMIKTVQWALVEKKQLAGEYESPHEEGPAQFVLHPYRLCLTNRAWYLIARASEQRQPWTFRVARFKSLRIVDSPAIVPEDFDLQAYFGNAWCVYRGEESYDVQIEFVKEVADLVTETTWHQTQQVKRHKDGRVTLMFQVDGLKELLRWVLGWSGRCKIIQPAKLREMVAEQLRAALKMNDG